MNNKLEKIKNVYNKNIFHKYIICKIKTQMYCIHNIKYIKTYHHLDIYHILL